MTAAPFASADRLVIGAARGAALVACLIAACGAQAQDDDWVTARESFLCKSDTEVREIKTYIANLPEDDRAPAQGCRVDYIKNGKTQTIWSSRTNRSYCGGKASRLATRLEASHFTCSPLHLQRSDQG